MADVVAPGLPQPSNRIATLDITRGVAVMGILAMNILAFALPQAAYSNPFAYGWRSPADTASWVISFIFIDGKMRGLFSFLFGASMLLVIERAEARGGDAARVHFARMAWLLVFGLVHFFFIWWGDILTLYAPLGMLAWFFRRHSAERLLIAGVLLVVAQFVMLASIAVAAHQIAAAASAPGASAEAIATWRGLSSGTTPAARDLAADVALYRGSYAGIVAHQLSEGPDTLTITFLLFGLETLGYMLIGMGMLKNGFLAGGWSARSYRRVAAGGFALSVPPYLLIAAFLLRSRFDARAFFALDLAGTALLRPVMIMAMAALIVMLTRHGGRIVARIAAAGRAAFTNYLGTSLLMTSLFYGYGLGWYGSFSRSALWLVVLPAWVLMLWWSKSWLDRFRYGPLEWLWRSLARGKLQPLRGRAGESS